MAALRHRDDEARLGGAVADPRVHRETLDDGREGRLHRRQPLGKARAGAAKFDAHEAAARIEVGILLAVEDEAVEMGQQPGDRGDDADRIGAPDGQYIGAGESEIGSGSWRGRGAPDVGDSVVAVVLKKTTNKK